MSRRGEAMYEWPNDFEATALGRYQSIEPSHCSGGISECDCRQKVIGADSVGRAFLAGKGPVSRGCLNKGDYKLEERVISLPFLPNRRSSFHASIWLAWTH